MRKQGKVVGANKKSEELCGPGKGHEKKSENDKVFSSVVDPDLNPDPSEPYV
jgi:hypothetical protein